MQKQASKKIAETITTETAQFSCDGGKGALGHPRVFLTVDSHGVVDCPYCGKHYQLAAGASASAH
jgi:uncharacterized Zn-finger protein